MKQNKEIVLPVYCKSRLKTQFKSACADMDQTMSDVLRDHMCDVIYTVKGYHVNQEGERIAD